VEAEAARDDVPLGILGRDHDDHEDRAAVPRSACPLPAQPDAGSAQDAPDARCRAALASGRRYAHPALRRTIRTAVVAHDRAGGPVVAYDRARSPVVSHHRSGAAFHQIAGPRGDTRVIRLGSGRTEPRE
jgi:hypothetical protein